MIKTNITFTKPSEVTLNLVMKDNLFTQYEIPFNEAYRYLSKCKEIDEHGILKFLLDKEAFICSDYVDGELVVTITRREDYVPKIDIILNYDMEEAEKVLKHLDNNEVIKEIIHALMLERLDGAPHLCKIYKDMRNREFHS